MLSENDKQNLFRHLHQGHVVLVTGAGFSREARNAKGVSIPDGKTLASNLWRFLYGSDYDGATPLRTLYEAAQTHPKGLLLLRQFLFDELHAVDWANWYSLIPKWFWRRIFTFNADDLLEQVYNRAGTPALQPIVAPDHYHERDQFLRSLQFVKLHGSITSERPLTFGISEYGGRAAARVDIWYQHFIEDYSTMPTVFVGTQLDEPLFWQYVELRGEQRQREPKARRPKCFLIAPEISKPNEEVLERFNIVSVRATSGQFFDWMGRVSTAPSREQVLRSIDPSLEVALVAAEHGRPQTEVKLSEYFYSFFRAPNRPVHARARPGFLLGAPPTWEDIAAHVDAHRNINEAVKSDLIRAFEGNDPDVLVLTAAAGGGKSTVAKRVAMELVDEGFPVLFSEGDQRPNPEALAAYARALERRTLMIFDNSGHDFYLLYELWEKLADNDVKPIFLVVARSNHVANYGYKLARIPGRREIIVPNLSDVDIRSILKTLEQNDVLGKLRGKSPEEQFDVFKKRARKQILVAMREATSGVGFDEILRDEFASLESPEAQLLYLIVALASDYGLTFQQMITAMDAPPNQTLLLAEKSLAGILVPKEHQPDRFMIRHPTIAEFIVDAAPRDQLGDAIVAFLTSLSAVLPVGRERRWSRAFGVYREAINHRRLFALFPNQIQSIRDIYERVKPFYRDDGHYWLQYGSFELVWGALDAAENYINQAASILPAQHRQLDTATAHLMLKKSVHVNNAVTGEELMKEGVKLLKAQMADSASVDVHPFHIFGSQLMAYIGRWSAHERRSEEFRRVHDELKRAIPPHLRSHPELKNLLDGLKRAELETAIHDGVG